MALAQSPPRTHDGFYAQLALGVSRSQNDYTAEGQGIFTDAEGTVSGFGEGHQVAIGGAIVPGLIIAGAGVADLVFSPKLENEGEDVEVDDTFAMVSFGPLVDFYPDAHGGFHVQAGVGFGVVSGVQPEGVDSGGASGLGIFGGVGYELWIADQWEIGGLLRLHHVRATESADTLLFGEYDAKHRALAVALMFSATYN